jgi:hypothetical protein
LSMTHLAHESSRRLERRRNAAALCESLNESELEDLRSFGGGFLGRPGKGALDVIFADQPFTVCAPYPLTCQLGLIAQLSWGSNQRPLSLWDSRGPPRTSSLTILFPSRSSMAPTRSGASATVQISEVYFSGAEAAGPQKRGERALLTAAALTGQCPKPITQHSHPKTAAPRVDPAQDLVARQRPRWPWHRGQKKPQPHRGSRSAKRAQVPCSPSRLHRQAQRKHASTRMTGK